MKSLMSSVTSLLHANRNALATVRDGLEGLRRQIREVKQEVENVQAISCDETGTHARIDRMVEGWIIGVQNRAYIPSPAALTASPATYSGYSGLLSVEAAMIVYLGPALASAMKAEADKELKARPGITEVERASRLEKLDRQLLDLELAEESIVRNSQASGLPVHRRAAADPRAVMAADSELPR